MALSSDDPEVIELMCDAYDDGCRRTLREQLINLHKEAAYQAQRSLQTAKYSGSLTLHTKDAELAEKLGALVREF